VATYNGVVIQQRLSEDAEQRQRLEAETRKYDNRDEKYDTGISVQPI